jgi:hypothetical protein
MPAPLPGLRGTTIQALYPFKRTVRYLTDVVAFQDGSEQRSKGGGPWNSFELDFNRLSQTDKDAIKTHVNSAKGAFDSTLSITLDNTAYGGGAVTYANLGIEDDAWDSTERVNTQYTTKLRLRQTVPQPVTDIVPSIPPAYPLLANGAAVMLPYTVTRRFSTLRNDQPAGPRYSFANWGGGLTAMPTGALMSWGLEYSLMGDADVATIEAWFHWAWGRWGGFTFVDAEDGVSHPKVRFDMDSLEIRYQDVNQTVVSTKLCEYF